MCIHMAAREDSEGFHVRTPVGSIMSVPALNVDQARQLAADEYRGFGPEDFELVDEDADPDPEAYPDPVDSDRPINEHDIWMLKVAMRKGSRAGLQSHYSRKNPTDRTLGLLLDEWGNPTEIPLDDHEALQQADGIGPHRAAQVVGAAVSNRLIERACRSGRNDGAELVTDGGQPAEVDIPDDIDRPEPKESINKLLLCGEKGYGEFDGPYSYSVSAWTWDVAFPLDGEYNSLHKGERSTLERAEGKIAVALADGSVEAYGHVKSVDEIEDELLVAVETPGRPA